MRVQLFWLKRPPLSSNDNVCAPFFTLVFVMAPHMTPAELDFTHAKDHQGKTPTQIHAMLVSRKARRNVAAPNLTNVRKALKGFTYKRGLKETRGRKVKYSKKWVKALNTQIASPPYAPCICYLFTIYLLSYLLSLFTILSPTLKRQRDLQI